MRLGTGRFIPNSRQFSVQPFSPHCPPIRLALGQCLRADTRQQSFGSQLRIGHQGQCWRVIAHGLIGVDINAQQGAGDLKASGKGHVVIGFGQFGANRQHHVGLSHQCPGGHQRLRGADQQRVRGWQHALGVNGQRHRRTQPLGQLQQRGRGVDRPATGQNQRAFGLDQALAHLLHCRRGRPRARDADWQAGQQGVGIFYQHVERDLNVHRPGTTGLKQRKGTGQHARQLGCRHQSVGKRGNAGHQCALVG